MDKQLQHRILVLDGAMGTMIQRLGLGEDDYRGTRFASWHTPLRGNNDLLSLTRPEAVAHIHRLYLEAGADIIETNTFNAQRISQADYGLEDLVEEMNLASARLARTLADEYTARDPRKPRFVAGSVGPTGKSASLSPSVDDPAARSVTFTELASAYRQQMTALIRGGVDALLMETVFDTLNLKAALFAAPLAMADAGRQVHLMVSATVADSSGRLLAGQTLPAFLTSIAHASLLSVGLNCSFGAEQLLPFLAEISARASCYVSAHPNAGLPNEFGEYDETPDTMAARVRPYLDRGLVNIIGGCCGTTPDHIARLVSLVQDARPRIPAPPSHAFTLSGLEVLETSPLTPLPGERGTEVTPSVTDGNEWADMPHANVTTDSLSWHLHIDQAKQMRSHPTPAEDVLWQYVRNGKLGYKIRRQHIVEGFIADFIHLPSRTVIEIDGGVHNEPEQRERDKERTKILTEAGYTVLRYSNEEVLANPQEVADRIKGELDKSAPCRTELTTPLSPGRGAGGEVIAIGERCNVAGSRKFLRLIKEKNYEEALRIARCQVEDGAQVLDINMDDAMLDAPAEMRTFLNYLGAEPDVARVPVMIDSSQWATIEAGLQCVQGKSIVNSISLKEGETPFLEKARLIRAYGAAVVVMAFDEQGQADTFERRTEICARSYRLLTGQAGFPPQDIIFDPNVLAIATGIEAHNRYAVDFLRTVEWIKTHLPHARVSGGVSNLSFAFRGHNAVREAMHAVFLHHAVARGLDMAIVNPSTRLHYDELDEELRERVEDVVLNRRPDATERLIALTEQLKAAESASAPTPPHPDAWRALSLDERLAYALQKGTGEYLEADLEEALRRYPSPIDIIERPLMWGMAQVGELFGAGKMFLPQVVKTARTMKQAVAILQPHLEAQRTASGRTSAGKVLLATVKGDVHDIGKNIVAVVLGCNNYEVVDLGVMVPAEDIVRRAREEQADIIGLSGLITPSLEEMCRVAAALEQAGMDTPLLIGGATTSPEHTAVKIAPLYHAPVVHVKDASVDSLVIARLLDRDHSADYMAALREEQASLRARHTADSRPTLDYEEAKRRKPKLF